MMTGKELRALRWAAAQTLGYQLSQQQVADRIGVSRQTIVTWEGRASVPDRNAERYVRAVRELADAAA